MKLLVGLKSDADNIHIFLVRPKSSKLLLERIVINGCKLKFKKSLFTGNKSKISLT